MNTFNKIKLNSLLVLLLLLPAVCGAAPTPKVLWYDGTQASMPQGALLTDNSGYFGEAVHTGVTYEYSIAPENPSDVQSSDKTKFGNRLLDGQQSGDWHTPVGMNNKALIVDFDFHQRVTLNELAVSQYRSENLRLASVEVKSHENDAWTKVLSVHDSKGGLHHLILPQSTPARYVRLTVQATGNTTYISQVWMWGTANPVVQKNANGILPEMQNVTPGDGTILSAAALAKWRQQTGFTRDDVTWQVAPTWQMLKKNPLQSTFLPGKASLQKSVQMSATKSEGESAAVFLVNASEHAKDVTVRLGNFSGKSTFNGKSTLYVAGAIWTKRWGQTLRPLFNAENKLGAEQMEKYLTNGGVIKDFPVLHLPPCGTALLWITVNTDNAAPGDYNATLTAGENAIPVHLKVLSQTLPQPVSWVRFWGNAPAAGRDLWHNADDIKREIRYQQSMGVTVWSGWPEPGSYQETVRQMAQERGLPCYFNIGISTGIRDSGYKSKLDPTTFDDAFKQKIKAEIEQMVQTAQRLGLDYKDWSVELWDEPNPQNMPAWAGVAKIIRETNPSVRIYMNPLFWTRQGDNRKGFATDISQVNSLQDWYNQLVDISIPILGQVNSKEYPQANADFYNHLPRAVRGYYIHPNPGRMSSWEAAARDFNGWGFYAYYVPRKDAWNDFDGPSFDYEIVYPGPNGFIPTIESESMRESWEDYRLLTLLKQQGKTAEVADILRQYQSGVIDLPDDETPADRDDRSIKAAQLLPALRERMMKDIINGRTSAP
jgi:hypothetical protein